MPRVSAVTTSGQEVSSRSPRMACWASARHQLSTDGVAESRTSRLPSSIARWLSRSREWMRGGPGGLWAASCSSSRTRVAGGGRGVSSAERVPTEILTRPRAAANHAARLTVSGAPLSSLAASSRAAQRAAPSRSAAMTRADPGSLLSRSTSRASRVAPTQSSVSEAWPARSSGGGATTSPPRPASGGRRASRVDPQEDRLSSAAQRPSASAAVERMATLSTGRSIGFSPVASPWRSSTTTPIRDRPCSGALTRWPR